MKVTDLQNKLGDEWVMKTAKAVGCTRQAIYQWKRRGIVPIDAAIRISSSYPSLTIAVSLYRRVRPKAPP